MNHQERFLEIRDFLKPYQNLWQNEIMLQYPNPLEGYPMEWIEDLRRFKDKNDLIRIEKKDVFDYIRHPQLIDFYRQFKQLTQIPQAPDLAPMPEDRFTWLYIIPKKQHEIKRLAPHINKIYHDQKIEKIVDIGGGIGLLAQTLANQYQLKVTSIDMDPVLQKTGSTRHDGNAKNPDNKVRFENLKVSSAGKFPELIESGTMPVGLHTCGRLALDIIRVGASKKVPAIVNFGCCYQTLLEDSDQNISEFARANNPLSMKKFALTLACRAHRKMDEEDYDLKLKVKQYRYAIHMLLHDHYDMKGLVTLGNSPSKLYDESFAVYVVEQFKRINLEPKHSPEELNAFYNNPDLQLLLDRMITAELIRNTLGRVLELYLLLDRVMFLEEQGYSVKLEEFFDEELSPRNIGITAVI